MYSARNRYCDIITYNKSRVKLSTGLSKDRPEGDYINGCYINSPFINESGHEGNKKIIATQGPLAETVDHFWQMILENNVTMIVSTCKTVENGRAKCTRFWPKDTTAQKFCVT
jgi:protein tyrosine phosphatase